MGSLDGEEKTGITTMYMEKGLDTGDMIDKAEVVLDKKETAGSLHDKFDGIRSRFIIGNI